MKFFCEVEEDTEGHEYVASCDELRAVASGATKEEAIANLKFAISELLGRYAGEIRCGGKRVVVEVP